MLPVPSFVEAKRRGHRDGYIEFEKAYYEVPVESISREVWVRSDGRLVRLFNQRLEHIATHPKLEPGRFSKTLGCTGGKEKLPQTTRYWKRRAAEIGPETGKWAKGLIERRSEAGIRVLMGLIHQLHPQHGTEPLEKACAQARLHGQYRLAELRNWLEAPGEQQTFSFLTEHEVIRDLSDYGGLVGFEHNN